MKKGLVSSEVRKRIEQDSFVSMDSDAYYSTDATAVDLNAYLDVSDAAGLQEMKYVFSKEEKEQNRQEEKEVATIEPDAEVLERIKGLLHPKGKKPVEKIPVYVPERLNEVMADLKSYIENTGVIVYEVVNIQYGKKLRMKIGLRQAEINLFYGKHGFSVVQSPRCGTSSELNQMMADLINVFLNENI